MSNKLQETIRIEVRRTCNLLHLNGDCILEVCELSCFMNNCVVPYTSFRDPAKFIPAVIFIWLRHYNYLIEWQEIVQYTSLTKKQFKNYLMTFYEVFPFEGIQDEIIEFYMEYVSRACDMVNKIKQFTLNI